MNERTTQQPVVGRPTCGLCQREMTPENSTVMPEMFLCDRCAAETQTDETLRRLRGRAAAADSAKAPLALGPRSTAAPGSGALTWSAEEPKRRGWWWLLDPDIDGPTVRRVDEIDGKLRVWLPLDDVWLTVADAPPGWWWAGPLVEPEWTPDAQPLPND